MEHTTLFLLLCSFVAVIGSPLRNCPGEYLVNPSITNFRRYVQIDTSKEHNLHRAVEFWRVQAQKLGLLFNVFYPSGLPVVVITVVGKDPSLRSIMLNSHMDVVPAVEEEWKYPPFSAYMDENGDIFGRGTQDDKDVAIQYIEAIKRLQRDNIMLNRTMHITLMPDEETGGFKGIKPFVKSSAFKTMNVGFSLDEGLASATDAIYATYEDKRPWQFRVIVHGKGGHGFSIADETPMVKAIRFINAVNEYREKMRDAIQSVDPLDNANITSVNMNEIHGGYATNIIPSEVVMVVDMRLSSSSNVSHVERMVKDWIALTGNDTELVYLRRDEVSRKTTLDNSNPYWVAMRDAVNEMDLKIVPSVLPATSDMLVLRNMGIPAVGFSPKLRTTSRVHGKDEYLNARTFLKGIDVYYAILKKLGNVGYLESDKPCDTESQGSLTETRASE